MKKMTIINSDKRMEYVKEFFSDKYDVSEKLEYEKSDYIILPLPCSRDGETICGVDKKLKFDDLNKYLKKDGIVFGGKIPEKAKFTLEKNKMLWYNYFNEKVEQKNAAATAEGVVKILIENTPEMLCGQKILLTGAGRITEYLAPILKAFGCDVTIATSSDVKKAKISMHGYKAADIENVPENLYNYNICVNTSPCFKINADEIDRCRDLLYVELAIQYSVKDIENAHKKSINILCAAGVPTVYLR